MVYQPNRGEFNWLPLELRVKLRKLLFPNRCVYNNLTADDVKAITRPVADRSRKVISSRDSHSNNAKFLSINKVS